MNGVVLVLGLNLAIGGLLMGLHAYRKASWLVATLGAMVIGMIVLFGPFEAGVSLGAFSLKLQTSLTFLGRRFIIDGSSRYSLAFIYLSASFMFGGGWIARPSRFFYSAGTLALMAMALALMVDPFLYSALFLEVAALAITFVLVDPQRPALRAAIRLLLFYSLGMMAILMAGWLLDTSGVTTGAPLLVQRVIRFLAVGFGVLLIVPPFHLWLPAAADRAEPYSVIFSCLMLYNTGLFILLRFLNEFEWLRTSVFVGQGLAVAGMITIVIGGLWALSQRTLIRATIFMLLVDFGATMLVLSSGEGSGYSLALVMSGSRIIGAGVLGLGAAVLGRIEGREQHLAASAYSNPLAVAAIIVGLFTIAGVPLTAGFPARWGALQLLARSGGLVTVVLVVGLALAAATSLRWIGIALSSPEHAPATADLSLDEQVLLSIGLLLCLLLGVFPQILFPWLSQALIGLENLIQ
jgi:NADH-quinone oxidoreductase subunit N